MTQKNISIPIVDQKLLTECKTIQNDLKLQLTKINSTFSIEKNIKYIGGVDISFFSDNNNTAIAAYVILNYQTMKVVYKKFKEFQLSFPYIAGFLAFRESPILEELFDEVKKDIMIPLPEVTLVDGCGIMHPNEFGLASHFGVKCGICTIGVSKKLLYVDGWNREDIKKMDFENGKKFGEYVKIIGKTNGKVYGAALKSHSKHPLYVSIGNKISLESAIKIVKKCCIYRIPEPIRQADLLSRDKVRQKKK